MPALITEVVTRRVTPLTIVQGEDARSIGDLIDRHLADSANEGEQVRQVTLELDEEDWAALKPMYKTVGDNEEPVPYDQRTGAAVATKAPTKGRAGEVARAR